ncbi:hypothetical protein MACH05_03600 [Qipengyuania nanhaisediminis]
MDRPSIGRTGQHAVERIDFANEVPLAQATDRRVAAHRTDRLTIKGDETSPRACARRGASRFDTGVPATNHQDIEFVHGAPDRDCAWNRQSQLG